ncbi:MAG: hypothetical protein DWB42_08130 [Chloroflexi bacterium]|nr:hypothetical protein [Chloroflexota bacterium]
MWVDNGGDDVMIVKKDLRVPLFAAAVVLFLLVLSVQLSLSLFPDLLARLQGRSGTINPVDAIGGISDDIFGEDSDLSERINKLMEDKKDEIADKFSDIDEPPGLAIRYMALVDAVMMFTLGLIALSLVLPPALHSKAQGCVTLIFSILLILLSIALIFIAIAALLLMVMLFLSFPFGTIAYFIIFGSFDRGGAMAVLGVLMFLKIAFTVVLILSHQRFLQNRGLMLILLTSFVANIIVSFLISFPPDVFVSITDALAAIVMGIIAVIWLIILLIGAIPAILAVLQPKLPKLPELPDMPEMNLPT